MENTRLRSVMNMMMNVELNKVKDSMDRIGLYKHWLCYFDNMHDIHKRDAIIGIFKHMKEYGIESPTFDEVWIEIFGEDHSDYKMMKDRINLLYDEEDEGESE